MSTRFASLWLAMAALFFALGAAADQGAADNTIEFRVHTHNDRGLVRCGLFTRSGWLRSIVSGTSVKIQGGSAVCVFHAVPRGTYAISAFHDENRNGKFDRSALGWPIEDYCMSRGARGRLKPPSFDAAKFDYGGGLRRLDAVMD
jgi:uncharacterized protein (DUF2141 family)